MPRSARASGIDSDTVNELIPANLWLCTKRSTMPQETLRDGTITRCPRTTAGRVALCAAIVSGTASAVASLKSNRPRTGDLPGISSRARKAISSISRSSRCRVANTPVAVALTTRCLRSKDSRNAIYFELLSRRQAAISRESRWLTMVSASRTVRSTSSLTEGMSWIRPATIPHDQAPASISPFFMIRG
jgi:hypothetical protein